jgi:hypothetical protein
MKCNLNIYNAKAEFNIATAQFPNPQFPFLNSVPSYSVQSFVNFFENQTKK